MAWQNTREKPQEIHAHNVQQLKERIKNKDISGVYIFYGDEEYTKNHYCSLLTKASDSRLNVTYFYGNEFNLADFISACDTSAVETFDMFSMMDEQDESDGDSDGAFRVIKLFSPDLSSLSGKDEDYFIDFLSKLPPKTIIIFWFYDGEEAGLTKNIYREIEKHALTVNFKREPVSSASLITWVLRHFSRAKINVDRYVAVHLCQTVGNSMMDLNNEIEKLIDYLRFEKRDTLETSDIDFICIKSEAAQYYDISDGALSGDFLKASRALKILREKADKKDNPINLLASISKSVNTMYLTDKYMKMGTSIPVIAKNIGVHEFRVKNFAAILAKRNRDFGTNQSFVSVCTDLCTEYDKKLKSSRTNGFELLIELIFKLSFAGKSIS